MTKSCKLACEDIFKWSNRKKYTRRLANPCFLAMFTVNFHLLLKYLQFRVKKIEKEKNCNETQYYNPSKRSCRLTHHCQRGHETRRNTALSISPFRDSRYAALFRRLQTNPSSPPTGGYLPPLSPGGTLSWPSAHPERLSPLAVTALGGCFAVFLFADQSPTLGSKLLRDEENVLLI